MPAQSSPRFPRGFGGSFGSGFGPLLGGVGAGHSDQNMRVSDAERQAVADRLAEHYGDGRLDHAEFDERVGRAMSAKTRADLRGLFDDLPEHGVPADAASPGSPAPARRKRRHSGRGLLAVALVVLIVMAAGHTVFWLTVPWLWLAFLVVIVLAATGHLGRSRGSRSSDASRGSRVD
jgi:hypothetical protein